MINPVLDTEYTTLLDTDGTTKLKTSARKFTYDYNGNLTQEIDYDWFTPPTGTLAIPSGATVLRVINTEYYNQATSSSSSNLYALRTLGSSPLILGKLKETTVGTSSTVKSDTKFSYDGNSWGTERELTGSNLRYCDILTLGESQKRRFDPMLCRDSLHRGKRSR